MHKLRGVAYRRTASVAAGLVLTGGVAGGVLLTSGAAYANALPTPAAATITITGATPSQGFGGTSLDVQVSTSGGTGGSFNVSGAGNGCSGFVSPVSGAGSCEIGNVSAGTYTLVASYDGATSSFSVTVAAPANPTPTNPPTTPTSPPTNPPSGPPTNPPSGPPSNPTPTGNVPAFTTDDPPLTGTDNQGYSYTFTAPGSTSYTLSGAPSWLSINNNGQVWGTPPYGTGSFSYSVVAWNKWGKVTAGPFWVRFSRIFGFVHLYSNLWCTPFVHNGQQGTCTLTVHNSGYTFAQGVSAQISLPWQLRADYCGYNSWYAYGCSTYSRTVSEYFGTLYPGQSRSLTVTFTAQTGLYIWGSHPGHRITVQVTGSASSYGSYSNWSFFGQRGSYSAALVTIIPRGFWW